MRSSWRLILVGYTIWVILLAAVYYASTAHIIPLWRAIPWALLGGSGALALLVGAFLHKSTNRLPWLLLAAANFTFVAGDTIYSILVTVLHQDNPFPSIADIFYLATYPLFAAGMLGFIRRRNPNRSDIGGILDALTFTAGLS